MEKLLAFWWVIPIIALVILYKILMRVAFGAVIVPQNKIAIVVKKFTAFGAHRSLPDGKIVALQGEAGIQADTLAPGLHWGFYPWQYDITLQNFINIPQGMIGVVESKDGIPLSGGRVLARMVNCDSFQDARAFLVNGGERGPQIAIIPPGTYRINTAMFEVDERPVLEIADNMVGVVTTKDGKPLDKGDIAGKDVAGHNQFQDAQKFIDAGGFKGLQEQVILAGRYYINPLFATVEPQPMTEVPIAHVGVVISYVGDAGQDVSGEGFRHGNLVGSGQKGVWASPLDPGKYPINPFTHRVENVPTANIVLNWADGKSEAHKLDANLCTITVRSSDGFTYNLDVSQIIHIPRNDAPKVIARFGTVANLVTQVLEPTIGNYFRNAAQDSDVIQFLAERTQRQDQAKVAIFNALKDYDVGAVDTLIGDITPPAPLMKTLTDRKLAEQEKETFKTQGLAQEERKKLQQFTAQADTQPQVVTAERAVEIAAFDADARVKKAKGDAESKTINAKADADVLKMVGNAEAEKILAVGKSEASVIQLKTTAVGQDNFARIEIGRALAAAGIPLVPQIVAGGNTGNNGGGSIVDVLLANLLRDSLKTQSNNGDPAVVATPAPTPESESAK
jgi:uncharacterized membrane protein YqiK